MKTLDERMEIITQRSQVLVKKRKRRNNMLIATVTPLCLSILLCCAWLLPQAERTGDAANGADGGYYGTAGSLFCSYNQVQILSDGQTTTVTDTALVAQLYGYILQIEELQQENVPHAVPDTKYTGSQVSIDICFFDVEGVQTQYTLTGKVLTNKVTGAVNYLSSAQLMQLRSVLREIAYEK